MTQQRRSRGRRRNPALDLFNEVPVTWPEVFAWVEAVAGIPRDSPRAAQYIRGWDVPGKVARAKLAGTFEDTVTRAPPPPQWWTRFRWY